MAYLGHHEDIDKVFKNPQDFYAVKVNHQYPDLGKYLKNHKNKNATYLSPRSQSETIDVIAG